MEAVATKAGRRRKAATEDLGEGQKPSEELAPAAVAVVEVVEEVPTASLVARHVFFPDLVPEWVPKLQVLASGAAILFATVAIVVERHEQRYHRPMPTITTVDDQPD
jgi:hypothetical protein